MKRATPLQASKTAASFPGIFTALFLRQVTVVKPVRLRPAHYKVCLLVAICVLLPDYLVTLNWNRCAAAVNEKCIAIPAFIESAAASYESKITTLFGHMLHMSGGGTEHQSHH